MRRFFLSFGLCLVLLLPGASHAEEVQPQPINPECTLTASRGTVSANKLYDDSRKSSIRFTADRMLTVCCDSGSTIGAVYLQFVHIPSAPFYIAAYDAAGAVIETLSFGTEQDLFSKDLALKEYGIVLPNGCTSFVWRTEGDCYLAELQLFRTAEELPARAVVWNPPHERADLLFVIAHPDDEHVMMGGVLPIYAGERGYAVQTLYLTADSAVRKNEALGGLASVGVRNFPVFLDLPDEKTETLDAARAVWETDAAYDPVALLTEQIRRFRPRVVVTHDLEGEYGHGAHRAAAYYTELAVQAAADAEQYPNSAEQYGAWQVQKLYLHLYEEHPVRLPIDVPLAAFGGKTAFEMAQEGYSYHVSQGDDWLRVLKSGLYDCSLYGLRFSTLPVSADESMRDDFFAGIADAPWSLTETEHQTSDRTEPKGGN